MNKRQRILNINRYRGTAQIVFERWIDSISYDEQKEAWRACVSYFITTNRYSSIIATNKSILLAVREAWKKAATQHHIDTEYHRKRNYPNYQFLDSDPHIIPENHCGHKLKQRRDGIFVCDTCCQSWTDKPNTNCTECIVYPGLWNNAFTEAERSLGYRPLTRKQMSEAGYSTGESLPPPVAAFYYSKSPTGYLLAYNPNDGIPKKARTPAKFDAHEKMMQRRYRCDRCYKNLEKHEYDNPYCDRCEIITLSQRLLELGTYILDSETTGLTISTDEVIDLGIIDTYNHVHFNHLLQPRIPISTGASNIHGIKNIDLIDKPTFEDVHWQISRILSNQTVLIYNVDYDAYLIDYQCIKYNLPPIFHKRIHPGYGLTDLNPSIYCLMKMYAQFRGVRRANYDHRRRYRGWSYKWHPLIGGDHSALGDCRASLKLLKTMAEAE